MPNLDTIHSILPDLGQMEVFDMARRRRQNKGELTESGGFWRLRWREDRISAAGALEYGEMFPWMNVSQENTWPEDAFLPYWLPLPKPPKGGE